MAGKEVLYHNTYNTVTQFTGSSDLVESETELFPYLKLS